MAANGQHNGVSNPDVQQPEDVATLKARLQDVLQANTMLRREIKTAYASRKLAVEVLMPQVPVPPLR
ncbi:hypothetical protein WJX72_010184 [[Myrmecia] bisecta]|uniref:Uncharacterized protein n=1 Tax=[Myrmecia] bisecta TaxID=41462 RepID=A0AAW1R9H6_9CHLO